MEKLSMPPKTKPPPSESSDEEESATSDEETEDEEQAEGGSGFEYGSDESTDATKKKLTNVLSTKQPAAAKAAAPAAAPGSPAKRTREVNGKKDEEDEIPNKKKKAEFFTPTSKAAPKPMVQVVDKKSGSKTDKGKPTPPSKEKPSKAVAAEKDSKRSATKRKTSSPAAVRPSGSSRSEDETPHKAKNLSRPWLPHEELALSRELQKDRVHGVYGLSLPASRSDPYWEKLMNRFSFMDKYEKDQRIERLCEKVRRMRLRYESLSIRVKSGETSVYKNDHEAILWRIWHTIWGPNKATPSMLNGDDNDDDDEDEEEEEEEEEDRSDDGSDEEEHDEIVPTQGKARLTLAGRASAQKRALSKKAVPNESSSEDDESNKEDSLVKATPPAVLLAPVVPAIPATAAISVPAKQTAASKSVSAKAATAAMDVDSGKNSSQRVAAHGGAQGSHAVIPAMIEKSVRADALPKVSDEMRAENLALLRDMRGTCVKMVEEAKAQSLLVTEKILEEARVKTIQIVDEARVKSAQIMEEIRQFVERLGSSGGQSGRTNGSQGGRWNDFSDNLFQGIGLLGNGALPLGDSNALDIKWREQSEAEQGLLLQRLQLVQEQARIQQEGIRLKLSLQKQQVSTQDKQG